ncbi:hypothetical protein ACFO5K_26790 [Nocardia halotolerans]|uniref:Uncharacterized protein n=1 Tax=Nocardia halotolerans TaxID=1755878 RepID=A0ABV8VTF5_9NOCA
MSNSTGSSAESGYCEPMMWIIAVVAVVSIVVIAVGFALLGRRS